MAAQRPAVKLDGSAQTRGELTVPVTGPPRMAGAKAEGCGVDVWAPRGQRQPGRLRQAQTQRELASRAFRPDPVKTTRSDSRAQKRFITLFTVPFT